MAQVFDINVDARANPPTTPSHVSEATQTDTPATPSNPSMATQSDRPSVSENVTQSELDVAAAPVTYTNDRKSGGCETTQIDSSETGSPDSITSNPQVCYAQTCDHADLDCQYDE